MPVAGPAETNRQLDTVGCRKSAPTIHQERHPSTTSPNTCPKQTFQYENQRGKSGLNDDNHWRVLSNWSNQTADRPGEPKNKIWDTNIPTHQEGLRQNTHHHRPQGTQQMSRHQKTQAAQLEHRDANNSKPGPSMGHQAGPQRLLPPSHVTQENTEMDEDPNQQPWIPTSSNAIRLVTQPILGKQVGKTNQNNG